MNTTLNDPPRQTRFPRKSQYRSPIATKFRTFAPAPAIKTPPPQESKDPLNFSSDSTLSEEEEVLEEEEEVEQKICLREQESVVMDNPRKRTRFADTIPTTFPLRVKREDIRFHAKPVYDEESNVREISFVAIYKKLKVICVGIFNGKKTSTRTALFIETRNQYEWDMSNALGICRNMATYIDCFQMSPSEMNVEYLKDLPSDPAWFFIKPYYQYGTLRNYMNDKAKRGLSIEPYYLLHMVITLFTALTDAHSQDIVLVDLSQESFLVGMEGGLYFIGFRSCIALNEPMRPKWIPSHAINCPEWGIVKKTDYKKETDVFCASRLLLELMQKPSKDEPRLYTMNKSTKTICINEDAINPIYKSFLPTIEQGLRYKYAERPTAYGMMSSFQAMRAKALGIECGP